ncbi:GntR family transcriptional regulator [Pasteurellaceae bacterium RH1A]|nr:GntR family transcriptional regulator [Pasteurellaceae bacterium RH1A]
MKKLTKKEASLVLQEKITELIFERNLKSGDLMPTENELIELFGVSRSSLREAIKSLEALHILHIHHGVGTFVGLSSLEPMVRGLSFYAQLYLQDDLKHIIDILDVREILQYGFAPMTLPKMDRHHISKIQELVAIIEKQALEGKFAVEEEKQIHLLIYQPLQNQLLSQYLDAFWLIYEKLEAVLPNIRIAPTELALQYRELVDAVEAMDLERMQRAILYYFQGIRQCLLAGGKDE